MVHTSFPLLLFSFSHSLSLSFCISLFRPISLSFYPPPSPFPFFFFQNYCEIFITKINEKVRRFLANTNTFLSNIPVCVLICRFKRDGRSKDLPQTSQGNKTLSPRLIVRILQSRWSPASDNIDEEDSSDVDSYSSIS